jgi:two-component system, response regulator, stage 0 sporulation protein F
VLTADEPALVLVVDDHADTRMILREHLEAEGFRVREASNGKEALDALVSRDEPTPSLILLDVDMPVMGGWELLAILKNYHRLARIPVVVVSGTQPHPDVISRGGIAGFLAKPVGADVVLRKIKECIGAR